MTVRPWTGPKNGSSPRAWGQLVAVLAVALTRRFIPTCVGTATSSSAGSPASAVHPHVRGDSAPLAWNLGFLAGSSPRAWGQLPVLAHLGFLERFIPTCVGTARAASTGGWNAPVHPHVRGDSARREARRKALIGSSPRAWGQHRHRSPAHALGRFIPTCVGTARCRRWVSCVPSGSSPRAWGQQHRPEAPRRVTRFIPTCVGTALSDAAGPGGGPVHPHVRGDSATPAANIDAAGGSSPRAWEQLTLAPELGVPPRFIPTCVGTAPHPHEPCTGTSVHPHVRGDSAHRFRGFLDRHGSSPRAWGQHQAAVRAGCGHRFIPTCVGTAAPDERPVVGDAVHPHVRGDSLERGVEPPGLEGSSPRAWGQRDRGQDHRGLRRFIPTCVGTATYSCRSRNASPVHPHVRGDSVVNEYSAEAFGGSSPRAWGQLGARPRRSRGGRFIPTCVGTASRSATGRNNSSVHPHVRGDSACGRKRVQDASGSSPRAWGQRGGVVDHVSHLRFIPTCVGTANVSMRASAPLAVHPHVRGDSYNADCRDVLPDGSSPRAWGQL